MTEEALTFDDICLEPRYTTAKSRKNISLRSQFTRKIQLNTPLVSSCMDTVSEDKMCIAMARKGGIGILHRYCGIDEQVNMLNRVKRAQNIIIEHPYTIGKNNTVKDAIEKMNKCKVDTLVVVEGNFYIGFINKKYIEMIENDYEKLYNLDMIEKIEPLINSITKSGISASLSPLKGNKPDYLNEDGELILAEISQIMIKKNISKIPIVDINYNVKGLITLKDIKNKLRYPLMSLDDKGRLLCGAAVGIRGDYLERLQALINAEVDVIVLDTAYGNSKMVIDVLKEVKGKYPDMEFIVGNVCSGEGYMNLAEAGADAVRVGIGSSRICSTRLVSGFGVPQITALMNIIKSIKSIKSIKEKNISLPPIISDGGIKKSADVVKALAVGADTVMMGTGLAGTDESAGKIIYKNGQKGKVVRGMAGTFANLSKEERTGQLDNDAEVFELAAEGIESFSSYKGSVYDIIDKYVNGVKSGVSYGGGELSLLKQVKVYKNTNSGIAESGVREII